MHDDLPEHLIINGNFKLGSKVDKNKFIRDWSKSHPNSIIL
jgi:hypothetical protein